MPVIPAPRRLRLEDRKLEASLSYIVRSVSKMKQGKTIEKEICILN
jgi:hypothetical protein